jgi:D-glycero-D-manno-heptose 1,7-bisphosphate phosphatase
MFNQANDKYGIDMKNSWMIGDKEVDIKAANSAGIQNTILVKSGHTINERNSNATYIIDSIAQVKEVIAS